MKRAESSRPSKLAREVRSPLADVIEGAGKLPGAKHETSPGYDLQFLGAAEAVALPVLAGFGALTPTCKDLDFSALLEDIATKAGQRNEMDQARAALREADIERGTQAATDAASDLCDVSVNAAYYLGLAIGMQLAGGGR